MEHMEAKMQERYDAADDEMARLRADVAALKEMVRNAYNEGFNQGTREHMTDSGGIPWSMSRFRKLIDQF